MMITLPPPKARLPVPIEDADVLCAIGPDCLLGWIAGGDTYTVIAKRLGIPPSSLACWIHNLPDEQKMLFKAAVEISAELLLDESDKILDDSGGFLAPEVSLAKHRADSKKYRAAIRNITYAPKGTGAAAATAAPPPPPPPIHITIKLPDAFEIDRHQRLIQGEAEVVPNET